MSEIPKFVQSRLRQQATAPADGHPDANVLSAFVEGGLKDSERENLLAHLSSCAECREVVSLSLPEQDIASLGVVKPASNWNWNPGILRWGAVAASVIVVAGAVLLLNPSSTIPKSMTSNPTLSQPQAKTETRNAEAREPQPSAPAPAAPITEQSQTQRNNEKEASDEQDRAKARAEVTSKKQEESAFVRSPVVPPPPSPLQEKSLNDSPSRANAETKPSAADSNYNFASVRAYGPSASAPSANAPKDAGTGSASKTSASGAVIGGLSANANGKRDNVVAEPQNTRTDNFSDLDLKASSAQQATAAPQQPPPGAQMARKSAAPSPVSPASSAKEKNSADQAVIQTQTVEVASAASYAPSSASTTVPAGMNRLWRITPEGKLLTSSGRKDGWRQVDLGDDPKVVRLVFAHDPDIWFAGANGRLYHSSDGGKGWSSVKGAWSTETEIVNMTFRDARHGELFTLESERWITFDGGKTWQRP